MTKKPKRRSNARSIAYYIVEISGWDWSYSFGVNALSDSDAQYSEYRHLHVFGTLLLPTKGKERAVELVFLPHVGAKALEEPESLHNRSMPRAVGSLTIQRGVLEGNLAMPKDALDPVLQMLIANRFKYVVMDGERMRYRKALIGRYRMEAQVNVEHYPDD